MNNEVIENYFGRISKKVVTFALCACTLAYMASGCGKQINSECEDCFMSSRDNQSAVINCYVASFMEGISRYSKCSDLYIIKGIALNVYEYGLNIRLVEDIKGNFPKNIDTFIVWGDGNSIFCPNRMDNLIMYDNHDVLIMLLTKASDLSADMIPQGHIWFEKPEDYATITCAYSVVKLSNGYVTGYILPYKERDAWWEKMSPMELTSYIESLPLEKQQTAFMDIMPWRIFQKRLQKSLINK